MSAPSSTESNSLTFGSFVEGVLLVCWARNEARCVGGYRVIRGRLIIEDDDDDHLAPHIRSSGES